MAQRTIVHLVDDMDGGTADESIHFALDGVEYEIDLSKDNAEGLRDALSPFVAAARRQSPRGRLESVAVQTGRRNRDLDYGEVREWAEANGFRVAPRGRIATSVIEAYREAH